ncbi:M24 family metallopeptidase [Escherichia coli]
MIDAGCEYKGYAGDITRTFPVKGKLTQASVNSTTLCWNSRNQPAPYCPGTSMQQSPVKWCAS